MDESQAYNAEGGKGGIAQKEDLPSVHLYQTQKLTKLIM